MNSEQKKQLKAQAHALNPVVLIGQAGLTDAVLKEIDLALLAHELIKIKIRAEKDQRSEIQQSICAATKAELVQSIGQVAVMYRKKPAEPKAKAKAQKR